MSYKHALEIISQQEMLEILKDAFGKMPVVTKTCVQALNVFLFNLCNRQIDDVKDVLVIILRGFSSHDKYLKNYIYIVLMEIQKAQNKGDEDSGIICINSILKEIDSCKNITGKNLGLRSLFTNLPESMYVDFEKYVKQGLLNEKSKDNSVVLSSEYFRAMKVEISMTGGIEDYHQEFFNSLPVNKYSGLLEISKMTNIQEVSRHLTVDNLNCLVEAVKFLLKSNQEIAAPFVEKAVDCLRLLMHKTEINMFLGIKLLNKLSVHYANKVAKANKEIEDAVHSANKSVSMLAILTLLKTGNAESVRKLSKKIEPFLSTMSNSYKMMAIDTMEKLAKEKKKEYVSFLMKAIVQKADLKFKKYILSKLNTVIDQILPAEESVLQELIGFLCNYVEDPEYYQLNMDILGILGRTINNSKDLVHIYNRFILDNQHVKNCAIQALYDLDSKFNSFDQLPSFGDDGMLIEFLAKNKGLKRGEFDLEELGDLKEEVLKYIELPEEDVDVESGFIKDCRSIYLTEERADFEISVVKKMAVDKIEFEFTVKNMLETVKIISAQLRLAGDKSEYQIKIPDDGKYTIEIQADAGETFNGVFEYEIGLKEDMEDTEDDCISLNPFELTILDFLRPVEVHGELEHSKTIDLTMNLSPEDALSKIVSMCNLWLSIDGNGFKMSGTFNRKKIVIDGILEAKKYTKVQLNVSSSDIALLNQVLSVFE